MRASVLTGIFFLVAAALFGHPNNVTYAVLNVDKEAVNGELFISGYQVAQLAQNFNLDPSQLSQESLKNLLRAYFDMHFEVQGRRGSLTKQVVEFRNSDPAEFLASGLSLVFFVKLEKADLPIVFGSGMFSELSSTQTNKLVIRDKLGRPYPGSRDVLLTAKITEFAFDPDRPDFSRFDFSPFDSDGDGIADEYEDCYGLDPLKADTDGDGFSDYAEFFTGWDPFNKEPEPGQTEEAYRAAIGEFARQFHRKPTETSLLLSYVEETQLKEEGFEPGAETQTAAVQKVLRIHGIDPLTGAESGFLASLLGRIEADLFMNFNLGSFFVLLGLAVALGFFHTGASGPGKELVAAYCAKDARAVRPPVWFAAAFTAAQILAVTIEVLLFRLFFTYLFRSLGLITYIAQMTAGTALAVVSVILIFRAVRRIRTGMVVGEPTFFDRTGGAVLLGAVAGLGAAPFLWAVVQMLMEIERAYFIPFFALAWAVGVFGCLVLVALAVLMVRYILLDILPKIVMYTELVSSSLMLVFALFLFFIRVPI
jgi:hypothetical protein